MKVYGLLAAVMTAVHLFAATPTITSVTAQQRYPWNGLVDIAVTLTGTSNDVAQTDCMFVATNSATQTALATVHITEEDALSGSGTTWVRKFVWDAVTDVGEDKIPDVSLSVLVEMKLGGVQLWENGPYWAECNVGATKPEECGYYFWWGDTVGYTRNASNNGWVSVEDGELYFSFSIEECPTYVKNTVQLQAMGYIDSTGNLVAEHDAATAHLGAPWRMPTYAEFAALIGNCTTTWTTRNGVKGRLVTGRGAFSMKSIFLPAAGYVYCGYNYDSGSAGDYWSSSSDSDQAWCLYFFSSYGVDQSEGDDRCVGRSVRPLRGFARGDSLGTEMTHLALDTRTGTRYVRAEEPIAFSTAWGEDVTRLVLNVGGENVLTSTTATNGVYVWRPDLSTAKTVTLKHTTRGAVNEALTATFVIAAYDVTFDPGAYGTLGADVPPTQRVPHGEAAAAPTVVPAAGYRFTGWNADVSNVTGDVTATAQYEAIPYAISYENLYGTTHANPSAYTIEDAVTFTAPDSIPRRQFVRWEPAAIAVGTTGAVTVRAVWEMMPYVYVDAAQGNDAQDGSAVDHAVKTLARAFALAEAGDMIRVAAGTYAPVTANGKAVTFRGADGATIDGGGTMRCVTADDDVVFENFTIQNGYDSDAGGGVYGGTFDRCTITNCWSEWDGGGAYEATLRNCVIVGNTAENGWGGGVYGGTLANCVVKDNVAGDVGGGAYTPESLSNTTFSGNSPDDVAGMADTVAGSRTFVYAPPGNTAAYSIPHDWLIQTGLAKVGDATAGLDAKLAAVYANGRTGWESYVAGLVPTDTASNLQAIVTISNGMVYVSWTPNLNTESTARIYTVYGRTNLEEGEWETPVQPWHRFFKVAVAMPTGAADEESAVAGEGFVPGEKLGGVQLWENGPYWAECNVGASQPEEYGYYFWWGDTVGYTREGGTWMEVYYSDVTWVSSTGTRMSSSPFTDSACPTYNKNNSQLQSAGYIDSTGNLVAAHDAATAHLGAPWRMPTSAEIDALNSNCDTTWTTRNGVYGRLVTGRGVYASKSIFLPAAGLGSDSCIFLPGSNGRYSSSTPDSDWWDKASLLGFGSDDFGRCLDGRDCGQSVRPVRGAAR